jgi:hypothetical protein
MYKYLKVMSELVAKELSFKGFKLATKHDGCYYFINNSSIKFPAPLYVLGCDKLPE